MIVTMTELDGSAAEERMAHIGNDRTCGEAMHSVSSSSEEDGKKSIVYVCGKCQCENAILGDGPICCASCGCRDMYVKEKAMPEEGNAEEKKVLSMVSPTKSNMEEKILREQMAFCQKVYKKLMLKKHKEIAWPFYDPVDVFGLKLFDYHSIIQHPMDLHTVGRKLKEGVYKKPTDFAEDVRLIFFNCFRYNGQQKTDLVEMAHELQEMFETNWALLPYGLPSTKSIQREKNSRNVFLSENSQAPPLSLPPPPPPLTLSGKRKRSPSSASQSDIQPKKPQNPKKPKKTEKQKSKKFSKKPKISKKAKKLKTKKSQNLKKPKKESAETESSPKRQKTSDKSAVSEVVPLSEAVCHAPLDSSGVCLSTSRPKTQKTQKTQKTPSHSVTTTVAPPVVATVAPPVVTMVAPPAVAMVAPPVVGLCRLGFGSLGGATVSAAVVPLVPLVPSIPSVPFSVSESFEKFRKAAKEKEQREIRLKVQEAVKRLRGETTPTTVVKPAFGVKTGSSATKTRPPPPIFSFPRHVPSSSPTPVPPAVSAQRTAQSVSLPLSPHPAAVCSPVPSCDSPASSTSSSSSTSDSTVTVGAVGAGAGVGVGAVGGNDGGQAVSRNNLREAEKQRRQAMLQGAGHAATTDRDLMLSFEQQYS